MRELLLRPRRKGGGRASRGLGAFQVLNSMEGKKSTRFLSKGLMYIEAKIEGKHTHALVDLNYTQLSQWTGKNGCG